MARSTPPVSSRRGMHQALKTAGHVLKAAKSLKEQRGICITCVKTGPLFSFNAQKLVQTLSGLEFAPGKLEKAVTLLQQQDVKFVRPLNIPLGDLVAFRKNYQDSFAENVPSIIAFYSIIRMVKRSAINVFVKPGPVEVDIQTVPGTRRQAVEVFREMQAASARVLEDNLVATWKLMATWLEAEERPTDDYVFGEILETIYEEASAPDSLYPI